MSNTDAQELEGWYWELLDLMEHETIHLQVDGEYGFVSATLGIERERNEDTGRTRVDVFEVDGQETFYDAMVGVMKEYQAAIDLAAALDTVEPAP